MLIAAEYKKPLRQTAMSNGGFLCLPGGRDDAGAGQSTARLCAMNLMLHGIGGNGTRLPLVVSDTLAGDPGDRYEVVLTNPPFGKKSSTTIVAEDGKVSK
ncbi:MAG: N-6 DNA methylase, partial [Desulfuromonadales bacterium]